MPRLYYSAEVLVARAQEAIETGEWSSAKQAFEALLEPEDSGEALFGLGVALAFWLGLSYRMSLGNHAASRGWLGRASSLVEEFELGPMRGWVLIARAYVATHAGDPQTGAAYAKPVTPTWSCAR